MIYLYQRAIYFARQDDYIPKKDVYRADKDDYERRWDDYQGEEVIYHHERAIYPAHREDYMRQTDDSKRQQVSSRLEKSVCRCDAGNDPPAARVPRTVSAVSKLVGDDVRSLILMAKENNESRHLDSYIKNDAAGTARRQRHSTTERSAVRREGEPFAAYLKYPAAGLAGGLSIKQNAAEYDSFSQGEKAGMRARVKTSF